MSRHRNSLIIEEWKRIAKKDWKRVKRQLDDGAAEAAGYFLQQSLEKYPKALLLQYGWKLRKIHALHDLLNDVTAYNPDLEKFRKLCERVSGYYFVERYPPLIPSGLTCEDIERDMKKAEEFIKAMFESEI